MCGFLFHLGDDYFDFMKFVWIWIAPIIISLLYGVGMGIVSILGILITLVSVNAAQLFATTYGWYALGGVFISLLCGEFRSVWTEKMLRMESTNEYVQQRLASMTRLFYLTRISHDSLEQNLITRPVTLRSALEELRNLLAESKGVLDKKVAERFLNIVAQYCSFDKAAMYAVEKNIIVSTELASLGGKTTLAKEDPLVEEVLLSRSLVYLAINQMDEDKKSQYLVAAPLRDSSGEVSALIVVEEMPFMALSEDNLRAVSVLTTYFADEVWASHQARGILEYYPDCPPQFAAELYRLTHLQVERDVHSVLMALATYNEPKYETIISGLEKMSRGLDFTWIMKLTNFDVLLTLMPMTDMAGAEGYVTRVRNWVREDQGLEMAQGEIFTRYTSLYHGDPIEQLNLLVGRISDYQA